MKKKKEVKNQKVKSLRRIKDERPHENRSAKAYENEIIKKRINSTSSVNIRRFVAWMNFLVNLTTQLYRSYLQLNELQNDEQKKRKYHTHTQN